MYCYFSQEDNSLDFYILGRIGFSAYVKVIMNPGPLNCDLLMKKDTVVIFP